MSKVETYRTCKTCGGVVLQNDKCKCKPFVFGYDFDDIRDYEEHTVHADSEHSAIIKFSKWFSSEFYCLVNECVIVKLGDKKLSIRGFETINFSYVELDEDE